MSPRKLQNEIKQDFTADSAVWSSYKNSIVSEFAQINYQDLSDHLLREFNRKIVNLGLSEDLMFTPFDSGFRFLGATIGSNLDADAQAYIDAVVAAGATVTAAQESAISDFITTGKTEGWYSSLKRLYLPIWQLAAANAICMKSLTTGTFSGSILHQAKGVKVSASGAGNMNTNTNLGALGITKDSYHFALLMPEGAEETYSVPFGVNAINGDAIYAFWNDGFSHLRIMEKIFSGTFITNLPSIMTVGNDSLAGNLYFKERLSNGSTGVEIISGSVTTAFPSNNLFILGTSSTSAGTELPIGAFSASTELSSAQDVAYTTALKTLWETTTGLTLL